MATENEWEHLISRGMVGYASGLQFFLPTVHSGNRMAAHLIGQWLRTTGRVPLDTTRAPVPGVTPPDASTPLTNHDHATNWDGHDIGEQRDQT